MLWASRQLQISYTAGVQACPSLGVPRQKNSTGVCVRNPVPLCRGLRGHGNGRHCRSILVNLELKCRHLGIAKLIEMLEQVRLVTT